MQENEWIQRFVVQPLTKSQQFIMNILCEYYEQRLEKDRKRIVNLEQQNQTLLMENKSLKSQAVVLRQEKNYLSIKVKSANNMLRILTKTKEDVNSCKTPVKINVSDVDHLLQKKLYETTKVSNNKKSVHVKSKPSIKVVRNKEVKKVALPKDNENLSCVKRTLEKDTPKLKEVSCTALKKLPKMLSPKKPMPEKSVILFKGKGNRVVDNGTPRITSKTKDTGKTEQKGVLVDGLAKVKSTKRLECKKDEVKVPKNINETFVIER